MLIEVCGTVYLVSKILQKDLQKTNQIADTPHGILWVVCVGGSMFEKRAKWQRWTIGLESINHVGALGQSRLSAYRCLWVVARPLVSDKIYNNTIQFTLFYCTRCILDEGFLAVFYGASYSCIGGSRFWIDSASVLQVAVSVCLNLIMWWLFRISYRKSIA